MTSFSTPTSKARTKLRWAAHCLRLIGISYALWVLVQVINWWTNSDKVIHHMGIYLQRDLSQLPNSASMMAMTLDLTLWGVLVLAVIFCWRGVGEIMKEHAFTPMAIKRLNWGGWTGVACEVLSVLSRPIKTYWLTAHLPVTEQVIKWQFSANDLLSLLLCGVILLTSYLLAWTQEIQAENRSFI
jgi:hypothetical protein